MHIHIQRLILFIALKATAHLLDAELIRIALVAGAREVRQLLQELRDLQLRQEALEGDDPRGESPLLPLFKALKRSLKP